MLVRDYCDQKLDESLNLLVDDFLRRSNELQERLRERDAIKAKMKRRLQVLHPHSWFNPQTGDPVPQMASWPLVAYFFNALLDFQQTHEK
jgi:hypothetical protein